MTRTFLALAAAFGALAVAAGAFAAHALEARLTPERLQTWELGARYQMYHALALVGAAWLLERAAGTPGAGPAAAAGWLFVVGILVFAGTLYALALGGPRWLGAITPIGGLSLIAGWIAVLVAALRA